MALEPIYDFYNFLIMSFHIQLESALKTIFSIVQYNPLT